MKILYSAMWINQREALLQNNKYKSIKQKSCNYPVLDVSYITCYILPWIMGMLACLFLTAILKMQAFCYIALLKNSCVFN